MALSNSQYNSILREYEELQSADRAALERRRSEVFEKIPELKELDSLAGSLALERCRRALSGDESALEGFSGQVAEISEKKKRLLKENGYPEDFLEMQYTCSDCRDTGFIKKEDGTGEKCHCFRARQAALLYAQSRLSDIIKKENFDTLRYDLYDDEKVMEKLGMTRRKYMEKVAAYCRRYAEEFKSPQGREKSILFTGSTGVGKTFLTNCIAAELMKQYYSVIYLTAIELFDTVARVKVEKTEDLMLKELFDRIGDCDMLIIDDLGSELPNAMTVSNLFYIINKRLLEKKATIISTNLSLNRMRDIYTERVTSRLSMGYDIIPVYGDDIRLKISEGL